MTTQTAAATYNLDPVHSAAEFSVKHLMVSNVKGRFHDLDAVLEIDEAEPGNSKVEATIRTASVDTGVEMRDNDLRSANFFESERYPTMSFRSTKVERVKDDDWRVSGDLTIRDVTRPVVFETEFLGKGPDFEGKERIGLSAETSISRKDFGLTYNAVLETGGAVVGDKVKISLNVEAVRAG